MQNPGYDVLCMNAFPPDPVDALDPTQNSGKLDSIHRRGTSAAFAWTPGPFLIQNRRIPQAEALGGVWATGTALRLECFGLYQQTPDQPQGGRYWYNMFGFLGLPGATCGKGES